jgi:methylmalonyl-CoA mutase C-terminal domain/subunit
VELLLEKNASAIIVIGGGIIPEQDFNAVRRGHSGDLHARASLDSIVDWIRANVPPRA